MTSKPIPKTVKYPRWLHDYVKTVQDELKLSHWNIGFEDNFCDDGSLAEIQISPAQHNATVSLCREWQTWKPDTVRGTVVHELMHCHINAINEIAEEHLEELSPKTLAACKVGITYVNERVTDALAEMVSPHISMPVIKKQQSSIHSHTVAYSRTAASKRAAASKGKKTQKPKKNTVKKKTGKSKKGK